jgi:hypothetical protein
LRFCTATGQRSAQQGCAYTSLYESSLRRHDAPFSPPDNPKAGLEETTLFRGRALAGHKSKTHSTTRKRSCYFPARASIAEIYGAPPAKTDIDWF